MPTHAQNAPSQAAAPRGVPLYQVDAFAARPFAGNPAAVCLLEAPAGAEWMQNVAAEMNLSETAFVVRRDGGFDLRWFTPTVEMDLCGHATLASAHALWETGRLPGSETARFHTRSGELTCRREGDWIEMDFPNQACGAVPVPDGLEAALGAPIRWCGRNSGGWWLLELDNERTVRELRPDHAALAKLPAAIVIVTARSADSSFDFVLRVFGPGVGIVEDPVTGGAHCALAPYWSGKLGKTRMVGHQVSKRTGIVRVETAGARVKLAGQAVTVFRAELA
jgi:predicted PhzF superfamily epimerase YddE/YHI9